MEKIAFIGLGHMGNPMVKNLLNAGYDVTVFDVVPMAVNALLAYGAKSSATLSDAVNHADVIITMLQTGDQVKQVCAQIFPCVKKKSLYIDSSSIDMATTQFLHEEAEKKDLAMVDAPVSGGTSGAEAGTLTFMVGGNEENFSRAKSILEKMGKKIIHAGDPGCGQAAKICNNLILGISMIAVSEGFSLADKLGLDAKTFFDISSNASGQCWSMTSYCPAPGVLENSPANHNYEAGFMAKMMLKDLRLGQHAAEHCGATIPLAAEAAELYSLYVNEGNGEKDFSGIFQLISRK